MRRLNINGITMEVDRRGSGPGVVLLHGLGGPAMWERVAPLLAAGHDVLLPHLPGFGESPPAGAPLTVRDQAALVARALDELGIRGAVLAGISYGGEIAAAVAASASGHSPALVQALVLIAPTGMRRLPWYARTSSIRPVVRPLLRAALANRTISEALSRRSFHDISARPQDLVERYLAHLGLPGRLDTLVSAVEDIREHGGGLPGLLERVQARVSVVWGENDRTLRASSAEELRGIRPAAAIHLLPECGHSVALERPEELARIIGAAASPAG